MKHFSLSTQRLLLAISIALLLVAPFVLYPQFLIEIFCFALLAAALNLLVSYCGLLSFGHAMFFGAAGYVTAQAIKVWGLDPALGILCGVGVAVVIGALTGSLAIRRQGIYFSMITLAFSQLIYFVALRMPFTGGEDGLQDVPRRAMLGFIDLGNNYVMYFVVLALTAFGFFAIHRIVNSPFGQVLRAIRDNEPRAISLGYRANRYKLVVFILSASLAGLAGAVKAVAFQVVTLNDLTWVTSGEALLICILGGIQTLLGPVAGAILIVSMSHYLASYAEWVLMIQGLVFVVVVLSFRKGLVGEFYAWLDRRALRAVAVTPVKKELP
ncbi:branched-chain amino acid ABC transporter permease [Pantoea sp. 18069]|uniref:branched-chain amino acid ABC transporter permease n=1 Tax=Pantoea sp. 18069 TaxID=2681415 RepID=UPI00135A98F1|nr:branched-chain amino acid ABC transporter permease [Pantoea sp. 18069]